MRIDAIIEALSALEEATLLGKYRRVDTPEVRIHLTALWKASDRQNDWLYANFWEWCSFDTDRESVGLGRSQNLNASLNGIYRSVKVERTGQMMFNDEMWARVKAADPNRLSMETIV
jgi:hypothetical protein